MRRMYHGAIERGEKYHQLDTLQRETDGLGAALWEVFRGAH